MLLGRVLYHSKIGPVCEGKDFVHLHWQPINVDYHDRLCP